MEEFKTTRIGRRYNELRSQGYRGRNLYDKMLHEFPDVPPSSARAYGARYLRRHPKEFQGSLLPAMKEKVEIDFEPRVLSAARAVASEQNITLNQLVEQSLITIILEYTSKKSS